jgi:hypothetical protein
MASESRVSRGYILKDDCWHQCQGISDHRWLVGTGTTRSSFRKTHSSVVGGIGVGTRTALAADEVHLGAMAADATGGSEVMAVVHRS